MTLGKGGRLAITPTLQELFLQSEQPPRHNLQAFIYRARHNMLVCLLACNLKLDLLPLPLAYTSSTRRMTSRCVGSDQLVLLCNCQHLAQEEAREAPPYRQNPLEATFLSRS